MPLANQVRNWAGAIEPGRAVPRAGVFRVRCEETDGGVVCHIVGNLEQETVAQFRDAVTLISDKREVIFEISAVPFVDSAGLGALIGAVRRVRENGGDVVVCGAEPRPAKYSK